VSVSGIKQTWLNPKINEEKWQNRIRQSASEEREKAPKGSFHRLFSAPHFAPEIGP
jgi:hypothetical protein